MQKRSETLRGSIPFKACLYLDPRFNFIGSNRLTPDEKIQVQVSIIYEIENRNYLKRINVFYIYFAEIFTGT